MIRYTLTLMVGFVVAGAASASWAESMFDHLSKDFGSVPRGPMLSHQFTLTNRTAERAHITNVRVSCGCVSASALQNDLAPGQSTAIQAYMDSRRFTGHKSVTIFVQFDRPQFEEVHLVVKAFGRDDISITPDAFTLGQVRHGETAGNTVAVSFYGGRDARIIESRGESGYVQTSVKEVPREDGRSSYQVTAQLRPNTPVGDWYTDVWLTTNDPSTPRIRVPLTVTVMGALTVSPAAASWGEVKMGKAAERKVIVRGSQPFKIVNVSGTDNQVKVNESNSNSKAVHVLTVTLNPAAPGDFERTIRVTTDLKDEAPIDFRASARIIP